MTVFIERDDCGISIIKTGIGLQQLDILNVCWQYRPEKISPSILRKLCIKPTQGLDNIRILQKRRGRVAFCLEDEATNRSYFVKYFYPRSWREYFKYSFQTSRASKERRASIILSSISIKQPELFAIGERRQAGIWKQSFLVYDYLQPVQTLKEYCQHRRSIPSVLIRKLACLVSQIHNHDIYYSDLHGDNILVQRTTDGPMQLLLIDPGEMKKINSLDKGRRINDLARLNGFIAANDFARLRFIIFYIRLCKSDIGETRSICKKVNNRTRQLWHHYLKKHGIDYERETQTKDQRSKNAELS